MFKRVFQFFPILLVIVFTQIVSAEQSINPQLQSLKQQSLLLDRDLLVLEDEIKQPFNIYLSQFTDAKFVLETMVVKLDGKQLVSYNYNNKERKALKTGGAQLLYTGILSPGEHKLIAYYRSNKDYQGGAEFEFKKMPASHSVEISLLKGESKESRLQPKVLIQTVDPKKSINEPVLYRYLKYLKSAGTNLDILSQIMKSEKINGLGKYAINTRLLKGQLYLEKGLHVNAGEIFKSIIDLKSSPEKLRNEAKFYLGKSYYHQGKLNQSLTVLSQVKEPISKNVRAEMQHLNSLILMSQGKYKQAAEYLRKNWWNAPDNWDLYKRYNLGVALIHSGETKAGFNLIKKIGQKNKQDIEAQSIVDKANQSLGYLLLNQNKPDHARKYLEKVRLEGPYSNLALLGAGWASARLKQYNQAIIPWLELHKKDIREIPVQESMLTVPYVYEQMGKIKKSAQYYQQAVKAYEKEHADLLSSIESLKTDGLASELKSLNVSSESAWLKSVEQASAGKSSRYIKQLIEDASFFNFILNYREARLLKLDSDKKIEKISEIQTRLLNKAGIHNQEKIKKNRDQITFIQILAADLLKRSHQMKQRTLDNMNTINSQMTKRALSLLSKRKSKLDVYLVQSRLALAQSYDLLNIQK